MGKSLVHEVLMYESVFSDICTEAAAVAQASSIARQKVGSAELEKVIVFVDFATAKNAFLVAIPGTTEKGIKIAAALGAICGQPELELECLKNADSSDIDLATQMISNRQIDIHCEEGWKGLHILALVKGKNTGYGYATIVGNHTNILISGYGKEIVNPKNLPIPDDASEAEKKYVSRLRNTTLSELLEIASQIDNEIRSLVQAGIKTNLQLSNDGRRYNGYGKALSELNVFSRPDDILTESKIAVAFLADARLAMGSKIPAWTSTLSGTQAGVATIVPWLVGKEWMVEEEKIERAVVLSQLINSRIHSVVGSLTPICGCSLFAAMGAAAAITYLGDGNIHAIESAINNVFGLMTGLICPGANGGCVAKAAMGAEIAIVSAMMALSENSINPDYHLTGRTFEESIGLIKEIADKGLSCCDKTVLQILSQKEVGQ